VETYGLVCLVLIIGGLLLAYVRRYPLAHSLVLINLAVFTVSALSSWGNPYGLSPVELSLGLRPSALDDPANWLTVLTHMFAHADIMHVLFNMLFLFLVGVPLEERVGRRNFALCFFIPGLLALGLEVLVRGIDSNVLILGASGAISGVMGALLYLYPRDEIPMFLGPLFLPRVPVWISVGAWFAIQVVTVLTLPSGIASGGVAYGAHLGGFVAGLAVAFLLPGAREEAEVAIDLGDLANTDELRELLKRIEGESEPAVRNAWLERFVERSTCPSCGSRPVLEGNRIKCACGWEKRAR
jgi:membrane associated rhomboid family serine protease